MSSDKSKQRQTLRGTIAQLAGHITVNGKPLGQAELSVLTRLGAGTFATAVERIGCTDENGKPTRGRPTNVWQIDKHIRMSFDVAPDAAPAPAPEPEAGSGQPVTASGQPEAGSGHPEQPPMEEAAA
jgi:hypothetical protein